MLTNLLSKTIKLLEEILEWTSDFAAKADQPSDDDAQQLKMSRDLDLACMKVPSSLVSSSFCTQT